MICCSRLREALSRSSAFRRSAASSRSVIAFNSARSFSFSWVSLSTLEARLWSFVSLACVLDPVSSHKGTKRTHSSVGSVPTTLVIASSRSFKSAVVGMSGRLREPFISSLASSFPSPALVVASTGG